MRKNELLAVAESLCIPVSEDWEEDRLKAVIVSHALEMDNPEAKK